MNIHRNNICIVLSMKFTRHKVFEGLIVKFVTEVTGLLRWDVAEASSPFSRALEYIVLPSLCVWFQADYCVNCALTSHCELRIPGCRVVVGCRLFGSEWLTWEVPPWDVPRQPQPLTLVCSSSSFVSPFAHLAHFCVQWDYATPSALPWETLD